MDAALPVAGGPHAPRDRRPIVLVGCGLAALAAAAVASAIAFSSAPDRPVLTALARGLIVAAPVAVGLYARYRSPEQRFGLLLASTGAACLVSTLGEAGDELLYTVGRTAGWLVEFLLVYVLLSFPSGRLPGRTDRLLVGAIGAVVLTLFVPQLVLAEDLDVPSPYTSCVDDCPGNALFLLDREPAFVDAVMRPLGVAILFVVMAAVIVRLHRRMREATPLTRRMLTPVLAAGAARVVFLAVALVGRQVDPTTWAVEAAVWLLAIAVPALALAFLVGLLRWRLFAERALQRLTECLRALPDAVTLRRAFAHAFNDPTIEILFPASGLREGWMDPSGRPAHLPEPESGRSVSEVRDRGSLVAAIVHAEGLGARPELVEAGVAMAGIVLDNQRLAAEAEASIRELRQSRARISAGAVRERRRIERDLHDGAQQRLVALRIELELAENVVRQDPERGVERLRELERELDEALEDLRSLAHGVYPPLLADRGLTEALRAVAARSTIPVALEARDVARYQPEVESAAYFCVLEALQNVLKHAAGARRIEVRLDGGTRDELRFSVRDDGAGTPDGCVRPGAGITNMQDRLAALGGDASVTSTSGVGTVVRGRVPIPAQPAP
jgi:signal transduction histidine kinase